MTGSNYVAVVGMDFSDLSNHAIDAALEIAGLRNGEVHVVYVEQDGLLDTMLDETKTVDAGAVVSKVRQRAKERVDVVGKRFNGLRLSRLSAHFRRGSPAKEVAQLAADLDADLVVVGSHGRTGAQRLFLGSVAERVSRLAQCPVWIVRPKNHDTSNVVPEIEPPCPDCVAHRKATQGKEFWCARHSEHHIRAHGFHYVVDGPFDPRTTGYESTPEG